MAQLFDKEEPAAPEKISSPKLEETENKMEYEEAEDSREEEEEEEDKNDNSEQTTLVADDTKSSSAEEKLSQEKELAGQKIEQLLKKYSLKSEDLPEEYQNWFEQIQKLDSSQAIAQFLQQMEEEITKKSQALNQIDNTFSPNEESKSLLFLGIGIFVISLGGLITWFFVFSPAGKTFKN